MPIENAQTWLNLFASKLSAADPQNATVYFGNAVSAIAEIDSFSEEVDAILDLVRGQLIIVLHDAYKYFEDSFQFPAVGAILISDAKDPSAARIAQLQGRIKSE